ncbi:hypothetical protein, partial [Gluconobacter albidus]|uniref:hypothetical protein n=1 Tax=Gluconobacter albidus TaxID=318683 RepID=UPI0022313DEB
GRKVEQDHEGQRLDQGGNLGGHAATSSDVCSLGVRAATRPSAAIASAISMGVPWTNMRPDGLMYSAT